ncbi:MAG: radical SAM protein [Clostridia bacterium]|nr:radical SAM protein [Clostridia bacterium]
MGTSWVQLSETLTGRAKEKRIPLMGQFELTSRCNLQCKMCYVNNSASDIQAISRERSAKEWIQLAEDAGRAGMLYLLLTGGEVFLRQDFREIYGEISLMGFNTHIYTNGTLITPEIASWLGQRPPSQIEISLYGMSPDTYGKVSGFTWGYERALRGIDLLRSQGINLKLRMTLVQGNIHDSERFAEFAQERGLEFGYVKYISPRREGCNTYPEAERLSPELLAEFEMNLDKHFGFEEPKQFEHFALGKALDASPFDEWNVESCDPFYCTAGKCSFWSTWDGKLTPCSLLDSPAAFPFENGFLKAWSALQALCSSIPVCGKCSECPLLQECWTCPARLKNETGFFDKPAPYLCELAQRIHGNLKAAQKL